MSMPYIITVEFHLHPGQAEAFLVFVAENARQSLSREPGCRRFDVLLPEHGRDRILLYEIYDDETAFKAHCASAHFQWFDAAAGPLVARKLVERHRLIEGGRKPGRQHAA